MKRCMKRFSALLLAGVLVLGIGATSFAAESTITFKGHEAGFEFASGSGYTDTDLFNNFKDVLPGDQLTEKIVVKNEATDCGYVNIYMKAEVVDELTYSETYENADGKDQADVDGQRDETVESMKDFLSQLTMRVYNGEELIYEASPDKTDGLSESVYLGTFYGGESTRLTVELDVPAELGNEYANRVGEVEWVFLAEAIEFETLTVEKVWSGDENAIDKRPESVEVTLYDGTTAVEKVVLSDENDWTYTWSDLDENGTWTVMETSNSKGYVASYQVENSTVIVTNTATLMQTGQLSWPIPVFGCLGGILMVVGAIMVLRKRNNGYA